LDVLRIIIAKASKISLSIKYNNRVIVIQILLQTIDYIEKSILKYQIHIFMIVKITSNKL